MTTTANKTNWIKVAMAKDVPEDSGVAVLIDDQQYAVFNFSSIGKWFATENKCPHKKEMTIARGLIGNAGDTPKVACAMHKNVFSLESGKCLNNDSLGSIKTFPVKIENGEVIIGLT